jgi:hypothetical protein
MHTQTHAHTYTHTHTHTHTRTHTHTCTDRLQNNVWESLRDASLSSFESFLPVMLLFGAPPAFVADGVPEERHNNGAHHHK